MGLCGAFSGNIKILKHRGDNIARWKKGNLAIACNSFGEKRLFANDCVLAYEGNIFNLSNEEIIEKLEGDIKNIEDIDGDFALAFYDGELYLARDRIGTKPLWYSKDGFASEKHILEDARPVLPGEILKWNGKEFEKIYKMEISKRKNASKENLKDALIKSIEKRTRDLKHAGLLFSGGLDSTLLAILLEEKIRLKCYSVGLEDSHDINWSRKIADELGLELEQIIVDEEKIKEILPEIISILEKKEPMQVGIGLAFYFCSKECKSNVIFSGNGSEDLFAGYDRHARLLPNYDAIEKDLWRGLLSAWERDLERDDIVMMRNCVEPRFPFLDLNFVEIAMGIDVREKINEKGRKLVLKEIAREIGVLEIVLEKAKKAVQYGSGFEKVIRRL